MADVHWLDQALKNVEEIVEYIAKDSRKYAVKMHDRIVAAVDRLELFPQSGWVIPEFGLERYREIVVWPYRILYRYEGGDDIFVIAVVHGNRDLKGAIKLPKGTE